MFWQKAPEQDLRDRMLRDAREYFTNYLDGLVNAATVKASYGSLSISVNFTVSEEKG